MCMKLELKQTFHQTIIELKVTINKAGSQTVEKVQIFNRQNSLLVDRRKLVNDAINITGKVYNNQIM